MSVLGKSKDQETFLDTIICKNKIKDVSKFGINDIKHLKSLLDVSSVKLWVKSSRSESEMRTSYKKLYKNICKYLDSMKKNCLTIKKFKPDELKVKTKKCMEDKAYIEDSMGKVLRENIKAKKPVNVKSIEKLNRLTLEFNRFRAKDENKVIYDLVKLESEIETYKQFELRMRMKLVTNVPVIMVKEFVEEKKDLRIKEEDNINAYLREFRKKFANSDEKKLFFEKLNQLTDSVGLSQGGLNGYFSSRDGFKKINNKLYGELAEDLVRKAEEIVSDYNKKSGSEKLKFTRNDNLEKQIIGTMGGSEKAIDKKVEKKVEEETGKAEGGWWVYWGVVVNFITNGFKMVGNLFKSETSKLCDSFKNCLEGNDQEAKEEINKNLQDLVENFLKAWKEFMVAYQYVSKILDSIDEKYEKVNDLFEEFNRYITNISNVSVKILEENKAESDNIRGNLKNLEGIKNLIGTFVKSADEIGKTVSKVKRYYDAAIENAEYTTKSIDIFVDKYNDRFTKSLDSWASHVGASELTLGQAILFAKYCIYRYEERCLGLDRNFVDYLEENERMKLGITQKEIKEIMANL